MRVSVVGCGAVSRNHLKVLKGLHSTVISSVTDINKDRADAAAKKYACKAYYDFDAMLNGDRPDCIHICTPHCLHVPMAVAALERGIHVLCEKPCAISEEGLSLLRRAQDESKANFGVCFQNRYNESVRAIKDIIDKKTYGKVLSVRALVHWCRGEAYYSDGWHGKLSQEGGGVTVNQAIHTQDLIRYLVGSDMLSVTAHTFNDHLKGIIEVEDTLHALLTYENGVTALFNATTAFSDNLPFIIDIKCEKALLRIEGSDAYILKGGRIRQLRLKNSAAFIGKSYWGNGHKALIKDFYDCIEKKKTFPVDAYEGGKAVEEFLAIYKSSDSGEKIYLK
ncbi:MAG: Gfo/Idh/MocA family oxidoreductase [Clostridia bacterium]|nr:Gfo/Idh/MocA family oxidoreductase [Clostridia bacterium]